MTNPPFRSREDAIAFLEAIFGSNLAPIIFEQRKSLLLAPEVGQQHGDTAHPIARAQSAGITS